MKDYVISIGEDFNQIYYYAYLYLINMCHALGTGRESFIKSIESAPMAAPTRKLTIETRNKSPTTSRICSELMCLLCIDWYKVKIDAIGINELQY